MSAHAYCHADGQPLGVFAAAAFAPDNEKLRKKISNVKAAMKGTTASKTTEDTQYGSTKHNLFAEFDETATRDERSKPSKKRKSGPKLQASRRALQAMPPNVKKATTTTQTTNVAKNGKNKKRKTSTTHNTTATTTKQNAKGKEQADASSVQAVVSVTILETLNTGTLKDLKRLHKIGDKRARLIMDMREQQKFDKVQ